MDKAKVHIVVVSLVFVLVLVVCSEGNRKLFESLFGNGNSLYSQDETEKETVEQLWVYCWKKIDLSSKSIPDFHLNLPYEIEKAITSLPPKSQQYFVDCLTRRNLILSSPTPNNDPVYATWLETFLDFFSDFSSIPRRHLGAHEEQQDDEKHQYQLHKPETDDLKLHKKLLRRQYKQKKHDSDYDILPPKKVPNKPRNKQTDDSDNDLAPPKRVPNKPRNKQTDDSDDDLAPPKKVPNKPHKKQNNDSDDDLVPPKKIPHKHSNKQTNDSDDDLSPPKKVSHKHSNKQTNDSDHDLSPPKKHPNRPKKNQTYHSRDKSFRHKKLPDQHQKSQNDTGGIPQSPSQEVPKKPKHPKATPPALSPSGPKPIRQEPSRAPTPAPGPNVGPAPEPTDDISPEPSTPSPPIEPIRIPPSLDTSPPPLVTNSPPPKVASNSDDGTNKAVIIGSVAGGVIPVLALAALIFFCCIKRVNNKVDPRDVQKEKDVNPLLNLSMSSNSGSEKKTLDVENPKESIMTTPAVVNKSIPRSDGSQPPPKESPKATEANNIAPPPGKKSAPPPKESPKATEANNIAPPPGKKSAPPPPPPVAVPPPSAPPPPLPMKPKAPSPPPPPKNGKAPAPPLGKPRARSSLGAAKDANLESDSNNKAKLKPFFWDKVSPDQSMVWKELKAGSFQVDEEMMESLFGYTASTTKKTERKGTTPALQYLQIIDPKKAQNLSILLKALNVTTEEVCDSLKEGTELPIEFIQTLLKMAPTSEEELKLRLYQGDLSLLVPAERFLKSVIEIPFAFKRMESLLFISSAQDEVSTIHDSFKTLEVACTELKNSRLFLKLLEAVLKTGNRMNDGTYRGDAQAFKLDTLLKLSDVKGTDGKTTLLHFVVQEIIRSEGIRSARKLKGKSSSMSSVKSEDLNEDSLPESSEYYRSLGLTAVSGLSSELENVKKAAVIDSDGVTNTITKLGHSLQKIKNFLDNEMKGLEEESEFRKKLVDFVSRTQDEIEKLVKEEKKIMDLVKATVDYFYGKGAKNEGLRLFVIVSDFLVILDRVCKEVKSKEKTPVRAQRREALSPSTSSDSNDIHQKLFPAIAANRRDDPEDNDF